jgi:tetratricopeptide (TPR) repeat protein
MPDWRTLLSRPWALAIVPLLFFPLMINVRIFPFIAPNEEPKWALLIACFVLICIAAATWLWQHKEELNIPMHWSVLALTGFYLLLFIGIWLGPNTTEGMIRFAFWTACLAVWLTVIYGRRTLPLYSDMVCWLVSLGSLVFSIRYWYSYVLDYGRPGYNISVLFSPIGHINFTGDVLVILVPAMAWMLGYYKQPVLRILNWVSLVSMLTMLLVASSRGALGGLAVGSLVLAVIALRHYRLALACNWRSLSTTLPLILIGSAIIASTATYFALPFHYRDLARFSAETQGGMTVEPGHLTPGAPQPPLAEFWDQLRPILGTRTPIYGSSTAMIADAPWLGQGTGNFFTVYPAYSNRFPDFRDPLSSARTFTTNPHNALLQIATQNGLPALLLFCAIVGFLWLRLLKALWQQWDVWQAAGVLAITAALFDAMFNHVFFNPASMFVFALLGALWWSSLPVLQTSLHLSLTPKWQKPLGVGLVLAAVLLSIWPTRWVISEYHAGYGMAYMRYPAQAAIENTKAYAWNKDNFRAVFGVAQAAYQEKRFDDCIAYLQHFESIYPYNAPALNMLAAAYMVTGRFAESKAVLERTLLVLPDFDMAQQNLQRVNMALQQQQQQLQRQRAIAAQQGRVKAP